MTNDELNQYIKHYIEKDKTGRAIMLTGSWGMGKSYYIKKTLIPYLSNSENGGHKCIVVSLYGVSALSEVSRAIYMEVRVKKLNLGAETGQVAILAGKTVLKGVTSAFGIDLSIDERGLLDLYKSIDLSGKLIIFEDVERAEFSILQFLGYVNSLVEQDGVKVLLVTNEDEILKYKPVESAEEDDDSAFSQAWKNKKPAPKEYTEETIQYLETKEKSVGDTIRFSGDIKTAIKGIIQSFDDNPLLLKYSEDQYVQDISEIMYLIGSNNLRSVIYACQKTADIFEHITGEEGYSADFLTAIFYGIVSFSLRLHAGTQIKWEGLEQYSLELGISSHPLFRFCFDYIMDQKLDAASIAKAADAFKVFRLYNRSKTSADSDLQTLNGYYLHSEIEVQQAVQSITQRLNDPEDISFYDYGSIATALITVKYNLGLEIEAAKELLVKNLQGRSEKLREEELFWYTISESDEAAREEYVSLRESMIKALNENHGVIPNFDYLPEQATQFKNYVFDNQGKFYSKHGFAKYLDINRLVEMFACCNPSQMNEIRSAFQNIYRIANAREFFQEDLPAISTLLQGMELTWERPDVDRVQLLQYKWFIENLTEIKRRLS